MRWAAPLVAALCLCWSSPPAAARTLVGNTGQPTATGSSPVFALQSMAMQFSTGVSGGPETLTAIQLEVKTWQSGVTPAVSLHASSGQSPGARIVTFTNPAAGAGTKTFAAPAGSDIALQANKTYTVVIESGSFSFNGFTLLSTVSAAEDGGGAAGWLIGDSRLTNQGSGWTVSTSNLKLKMAVLGHTASNDATLGALTLVDGAGNAIDLQPGFAAGATSYTAAVDHSVGSATVTAIATDTAATVSIANDDDESTPGTAGLGLEVGANTVTVTVTAADGATTGSYTVTVTRAAAPATPGPTPNAQTLVGNTGQAAAMFSSPVFAVQSVATQFSTGNSAGRWTLTAIQLEVKSWQSGVTPSVSLHGASGQSPGAEIATLTTPARGTGSRTFTAPPGVKLQPDTTYTVVIESQGLSFSGFSLLNTESASEDGGGAAGWRIADARLTNQGSGWTVSTSNLKLKIAVTGTADSGDATLGALTLADGEGNAIALDPGFAAGTASYTAAVAHPVSSVAVTATAADTGATVSIANDDDNSTPDTADLGLEVGANTVTVTVTAADAATTGSYTVTVTRAAAAPTPAPGPQTLIGNTGRKLHGSLGVRKAQRRVGIKFTTGDSTAAWKMTAIRLLVTAWRPDVTPTVRLRDVSGSWPGTTIATLANPSPGTGSKTFMAPSGLKLRPNTTYAVVVAAGVKAGKFSLGITKSNHEDSGGAAGWSIANASRLDASGNWSSRPQSLMLAVQGAAVADDATPDGLTGWFASGPAEHDGSATFTVRIGFSDPVRISRSAMRDRAVQASGARVTSAKRVAKSGALWDIKTAPAGLGPVTLTVEGGRDCGATGAVCTADGRALADTLALSVPGPLALSVADARAREGPDATVDFAVALNRASSRPVTVGYRTADGTARAGEDYTATSGTLTFAAGIVQQTVSVPVLDDAIDEGEESFAFALSDASGAVIADGGATGTIVNSDPMPRAWIARFGRTVASQTVDAIGKRLAGGGSSRITVGGVALGGPGNARDPEGERDRGLADLDNPRNAGFTRTMSPRELLLGSAFRLSGGADEGSSAWTAWGRIASSGFSAAEDRVRLDGDVTSGFFGVDLSRQRWLAGLAVSVSEGEGSFEPVGDGMTEDRGRIRSGLKGIFPYARYRVTEKLDVWGLVGYGRGELTLIELADANRPRDVTTRTGLSMRMGAIGTYGEVFSARQTGGLELAVRSDAFWVRTESEAVGSQRSGRMDGSTGDATRLRVVVQGSRSFKLEAESSFTPSLEVGIRHDGGDAETGAGIEIGAGTRFVRRGFAMEGAVNRLVMHEDGDFEQWGASGSIRLDSGAGDQGFSVSLVPAWGATSRGADHLWSLANTGDFAPDGDYGARWSLETEIGYGYRLSATEGVLTPYAGLSLAGAGNRSYRAGASWKIRPQTTMRMQAVRDDGIGGAPPAYSLAIRAATRW